MQNPFRVIIRSGARAGQIIMLEKNELFIGRDTNNDLVIEDPEVSRRHARLFTHDGGYSIEDLGSTNGTSINNQRLSAARVLSNGDLITLGEHTNLIFEGLPPDQAATVAAQAFRMPSDVQPEPASADPYPARPVPPPPPVMSPPAPSARPAPSYPPQPAYVPQQPSYPSAGFDTPMVEEAPPRRRLTTVTLILLILLGCLLLSCIVFAIIDTLNLYCTLFPGIVNTFVPGYCP